MWTKEGKFVTAFFFSRINNLSSLVQNWYPYSNVCVCVCMQTFIFHCGFFPWTETLPIPNSQSAPPLDHPTWKMTNSSSTKKFSGPHRRGTWFRPGWVSFNGIFRPSGSLWIWTTNVYIWKSFPPPSTGVVAARNNGHDKWWKICFAGKMSCLRGAKSC